MGIKEHLQTSTAENQVVLSILSCNYNLMVPKLKPLATFTEGLFHLPENIK